MAVNPFGDASDSIHAWREKYRQVELQATSLRQALSETKAAFDELKSMYEVLSSEYNEVNSKHSETKKELVEFRKIARERANEIDFLMTKLDVDALDQLRTENLQLKEKIEDLTMEKARGGENIAQKNSDKSNNTKYFSLLIPVIMNEYDPENEKYGDGFKNLVELAINEADAMTQIVAILYKYGGQGPMDRVRGLVKDKANFDTAIDILLEEKLITRVDYDLHLYSKSTDMALVSNWNELTIGELIDMLENVIEKGNTSAIEKSIDNFRDELTERDISVATIFFQIRKLKEGLVKKELSRKDALNTLEEWRSKLTS